MVRRHIIPALAGLSLACVMTGCLGVAITPPSATEAPSAQANPSSYATPGATASALTPTVTVAIPSPTPASPTPTPLPTTSQVPGPLSSPPTSILDLDFINASRGWVLGTTCDSSGLCNPSVYTTDDGGRTWAALAQPVSLQPTPTPSAQGPAVPGKDVSQVRFLDAQRGWAFDPGFFATTDGGRSWSDQNPAGEVVALEVAGGTAWALQRVCPNLTQCTFQLLALGGTNGGWQPLAVQPQVLGVEVKMTRPDASDAWILSWIGGAPSNLMVTHDGGASWSQLASPCVASFDMAIDALDANHVWVLCGGDHAMGLQEKSLFVSEDGGNQWDLVASASINGGSTLPMSGYVASLSLASSRAGWMGLAEGTLYETTDSGQVWNPALSSQAISAGVGVNPVLFVDPETGWAASGNLVYSTTDGGTHWMSVPVK